MHCKFMKNFTHLAKAKRNIIYESSYNKKSLKIIASLTGRHKPTISWAIDELIRFGADPNDVSHGILENPL